MAIVAHGRWWLFLFRLRMMLAPHQQHRPHSGRAPKQLHEAEGVEAARGLGELAGEIEELHDDGQTEVEEGLVAVNATRFRR